VVELLTIRTNPSLTQSPASLNRHFRGVTAVSLVQYQKQDVAVGGSPSVLAESHETATAFQVGYASPSQFSREYARPFGSPSMTNAVRLRSGHEQVVVRNASLAAASLRRNLRLLVMISRPVFTNPVHMAE
jgi:hypothetical protein